MHGVRRNLLANLLLLPLLWPRKRGQYWADRAHTSRAFPLPTSLSLSPSQAHISWTRGSERFHNRRLQIEFQAFNSTRLPSSYTLFSRSQLENLCWGILSASMSTAAAADAARQPPPSQSQSNSDGRGCGSSSSSYTTAVATAARVCAECRVASGKLLSVTVILFD